MKALVDNDILIKASCFGFLNILADVLPGGKSPCGVLGAAPFLVPKRISRLKLSGSATASISRFEAFVAQHEVVEPTQEEQVLAAELEAIAQSLALNLDAGESQLAAVTVTRLIPSLVTGDKRAISALEQMIDRSASLQRVIGRVLCLEQVVRALVSRGDYKAIRDSICGEPFVDKTMTICFSCSNSSVSLPIVIAGLDSYVEYLRASAQRALAK